jgi:hypothetical protein
MDVLRDDEMPEWLEMTRKRAREDGDTFVPRPGCPIYGLAAPMLTPVSATETSVVNDEWTSITLSYGPRDPPDGPHVAVTTAVADPAALVVHTMHGDGPEADLRCAVRGEQDRFSVETRLAGAAETAGAEPFLVTREELPAGPALVVRDGILWAARLLPTEQAPAPGVVVTIVGRGATPESVRLTPLADLRPMFEARVERIVHAIERGRRRPRPPQPPLPEIAPAEGVAALAALADFTLATGAAIRASAAARRKPQHAPDWGDLHSALWQRAVREQQRLTGADARAANEGVTSAINHLGHLAEHAEWFSTDPRLRAAAIDETLKRAMLGDTAASEPAQAAWIRYWSVHTTRPGRDPESADPFARIKALEALTADWLQAWATWAATA